MDVEKSKCYFQSIKGIPEVRGGISVFRLWQKEQPNTKDFFCHLSYKNGIFTMSPQAESIMLSNTPNLTVSEQIFDAIPEEQLADNNAFLETIINDVLTDDIDAFPKDDTSVIEQYDGTPISNRESFDMNLHIDDDRMLSQEDINNYPVKLTQQQLLLLNSISNRLTWLFNDISKLGMPMQALRPHMTALQRMVVASRDIQCKIQSSVRKQVALFESTSVTPESCVSVDSRAVDKEKRRLENQLDALNEKLTFFSSEYQRITELYLKEKMRNEDLNDSARSKSTENERINWNEELKQRLEQYKVSIDQLMEERGNAQKQLQILKTQAEDLEYALKVLLETGTIIPQQLDDRIQDAMESLSDYSFEDDLLCVYCTRILHCLLIGEILYVIRRWSVSIISGDED